MTGAKSPVHLFVATLPHSGLIHISAWLNEKMDAWVGGHIAAFEYFGATPKLLISDNARTATVPRRDGNQTIRAVTDRYARVCKHYGLAVFPTDVWSPTQKGAVENSVGISYRRVLGYLEQEIFHTLAELREELAERVEALNRDFTHADGTTRYEIFVEDEAVSDGLCARDPPLAAKDKSSMNSMAKHDAGDVARIKSIKERLLANPSVRVIH